MSTVEEIISFYANPKTNIDQVLVYVTAKIRQKLFFNYNNKVTRGGRVYEYQWENMKGGVWKITGLRILSYGPKN